MGLIGWKGVGLRWRRCFGSSSFLVYGYSQSVINFYK